MTKKITQAALFTGILIVVTATISIPVAGYGFVNLSDTVIFLIASVLPLKYSFLIAGIGCSMADILLGFGQYAIFTFFIKAMEAVIVSQCKVKMPFIKFLFAGLFMMTSYAFVDVILTGEIIAFIPSLLYNGVQAVTSIALSSILVNKFTQYYQKMNH